MAAALCVVGGGGRVLMVKILDKIKKNGEEKKESSVVCISWRKKMRRCWLEEEATVQVCWLVEEGEDNKT